MLNKINLLTKKKLIVIAISLFIIFIIVIIIILLLNFYDNNPKSNGMEVLNYKLINLKDNFINSNVNIPNEFDIKNLPNTLIERQVRFEGGNFNIISFSKEKNGDQVQAEGCNFTRFRNFIEYQNKYFEVNLNTLYIVLNPIKKEDFIELVNLQYYLNPVNCRMAILLFDGSQIYSPTTNNSSCIPYTPIDVGSIFTKSQIETRFSYYALDFNFPLKLNRLNLIVKDSILSTSIEEVFSCDE